MKKLVLIIILLVGISLAKAQPVFDPPFQTPPPDSLFTADIGMYIGPVNEDILVQLGIDSIVPDSFTVTQGDSFYIKPATETSTLNYFIWPTNHVNETSLRVEAYSQAWKPLIPFIIAWDTPVTLHQTSTGKVSITVEIKKLSSPANLAAMTLGFVYNGVWYQSPTWSLGWIDTTTWHYEPFDFTDANGNPPPAGPNNCIEINHLFIAINHIHIYLHYTWLLIDNIIDGQSGYLICGSGDPLQPTGIEPINNILSTDYSLSQNYPNPFNPETTIEFSIPQADQVTFFIYNILGQAVIKETYQLTPGTYQYQFTGVDLPSGLYLYRLTTAAGFSQTKKMILKK
jgi:hypothetical protein